MFFVNWYLIRSVSVCFALLCLGGWAVWAVRQKRWAVKISVIAISLPIGAVASFLLLLFVLGQLMGCESHGRPVYSPNGKSAARVETTDAGALGGDTVVAVYTAHGFRTKTVFFGGWRSVEDEDVLWTDDKNLTIRYEHWTGFDEQKTCSDFGDIRVHCVAKGP